MGSEYPDDCKRVCHKRDPKPRSGVSQYAKIQPNHRKEAEAVETKQNGNDADHNPCPASGAEKTDGGRCSESTETRTDESADDITAGQSVAHVQKPQTLNDAEGKPYDSEQQPNRTNDAVVCHTLSNGLYDAPTGSFIETQKSNTIGQHPSDPSAFSTRREQGLQKIAMRPSFQP
jgi:hypothetical protein